MEFYKKYWIVSLITLLIIIDVCLVLISEMTIYNRESINYNSKDSFDWWSNCPFAWISYNLYFMSR